MAETLIQRIKELEDELERLRSQLKESREGGEDMSSPSPNEESSSKRGKKSSKERPFDFSAHPRRHVAMRLAYLGWAYQGFAVQENTDNTVEARLFEALLKTRLIHDRQSSNYHRCGRTDKGVSAFSQVRLLWWNVSFIIYSEVCSMFEVCVLSCLLEECILFWHYSWWNLCFPQVITIDLRSTQFCEGVGITLPENVDLGAKSRAAISELPYIKMLNRVLPPDIRILDWAPVAEGFSARFDCQSRTYRYYFPRGSLDVALMAEAAKR